ncbi:MAG TPA: glycosyltransferase family 4 protein, partial [Planctomycetia bacterium]|nr:glycosyltransferase family 4 protein [Planctomycetia bacterium]
MNPETPRVAFFNRSYWPDAEATGQLLVELCEDLVPEFRPVVLPGRPNADLSGLPEGAWKKTRERNGVEILRVPHSRFHKRHWLGRAVNWATFAVAAFFRGLFMRRPAAIVVETDPPMLCLVGLVLKYWHRAKFVVYLQDIYPDVAVVLRGLSEGRFTRLLRRLFVAAYKRADRVVVLSRDMKEFLVSCGVRCERIAIIPNWVDAKLVRPVKTDNPFRKREGLDGKFVAMYSGNLGFAQRLENVLEAAALLKDRTDIVFLMVGDGASKRRLEALAAERKLANVRFLGYQPKEELAASLSAADLHLVPLHPQVLRFLMPSKIYGILAAGTAALVVSPPGTELARLVEENGVGFTAPPDDPIAFAEAVRRAADDPAKLAEMGERGYRLALSDFD